MRWNYFCYTVNYLRYAKNSLRNMTWIILISQNYILGILREFVGPPLRDGAQTSGINHPLPSDASSRDASAHRDPDATIICI